jgi:hypothetical protein
VVGAVCGERRRGEVENERNGAPLADGRAMRGCPAEGTRQRVKDRKWSTCGAGRRDIEFRSGTFVVPDYDRFTQ